MARTKYYGSPRWSGEITDCSMPMTFDTYSECSYRCQYCFAFYQKAIGVAASNYLNHRVRPVNVNRVKRIFLDPDSSQFGHYIRSRKVMQWGGMSDPFDEHERKHGVSLWLLKFFRGLNYPIRISTKGTWWVHDPRYREVLTGATNFYFLVSIITNDEAKARKVETGCPSIAERIELISALSTLNQPVNLRFRPFIIGVSTPTHIDLIERAHGAGALAVSTEFLCVETRARRARTRFEHMSRVAGYDIVKFYRMYSPGQSGYLRLDRAYKRRYVDEMQECAHRLGMGFFVSDADFKERCDGASCCGLPDSWNYSRGQFTEALLIARDRGSVRFSDIEAELEHVNGFPWGSASGFNQNSSEARAGFHGFTMKDWIRWVWNNPNSGKSLYKYFGGVLAPSGKDEQGDVIYEYQGA